MPKNIDLDVRPLLREKKEPFQVIMETMNGLNDQGDTLVLHATFRPDPLLGVMKKKGFSSSVEKLEDEDDHWVVTFVRD